MTTNETALSPASSLVADVVARFSEPAWLKEAREQAFAKYGETPAPRLEKTDLRRRTFDIGPFSNLTAGPSARARRLLDSLQNSPFVFIRDGVVVQTNVPAELASKGIVFSSLHQAVGSHEAIVRKHLSSVVTADESKWAALNTAAWTDGAFVYVPRNTALDGTVTFVYESSAQGHGTAVHSLVVAEEGSELAYTEVFLVDGELESGKVHSDVLEVVAGSAARVTVAVAAEYKKGPTNFTVRRAKLSSDSKVDWLYGDVGDGFTVGVLESDLVGNGSVSTASGIGLGYGRQHMDMTVSMLHRGRHTESNIVMHGALRERANSIYRTSTHIFRKAVGAGSEQNDRMLMLDGTARADAIPMLLIDENDVQRCGHAASVGQMDAWQLYYLQSRGIPEKQARRMIIWGYLEPTLGAYPNEAVRDFLREQIDKELV
ncbi:SufD family Fe-S cluster assembly protein [Alicyclobacillus curvatus]|nr:SufD family Fe-S cluster assembly protein [Alicyclobacillus curvatus]